MKFTTNDLNVFIRFAKKIYMSNTTFIMIKPDAVERGLIGNILKDINDAGFKIKALKLTRLSLDEAKTFYSVHSERPFFDELTKFMSRSPIVAAVLEKENAVSEFRNLIGDTDPSTAKEGTIRNKYAISKGENSVHGSDSDENANIEAKFHFSGREILL
jgi:nucleoside-diphosphate kinase